MTWVWIQNSLLSVGPGWTWTQIAFLGYRQVQNFRPDLNSTINQPTNQQNNQWRQAKTSPAWWR